MPQLVEQLVSGEDHGAVVVVVVGSGSGRGFVAV